MLIVSLCFITSFFIFFYVEYPLTYSTSPIVKISPECGTLKDHRINMTVNGFNKNGNVYWEFITSKGIIDYYGYFDTNATGGFNDYTIADGLLPDMYTLRFFDDKNNDYIKDPNGSEVILDYEIPCNSVLF
jgi:hypothetical protein